VLSDFFWEKMKIYVHYFIQVRAGILFKISEIVRDIINWNHVCLLGNNFNRVLLKNRYKKSSISIGHIFVSGSENLLLIKIE
jgi:hypothetical protein